VRKRECTTEMTLVGPRNTFRERPFRAHLCSFDVHRLPANSTKWNLHRDFWHINPREPSIEANGSGDVISPFPNHGLLIFRRVLQPCLKPLGMGTERTLPTLQFPPDCSSSEQSPTLVMEGSRSKNPRDERPTCSSHLLRSSLWHYLLDSNETRSWTAWRSAVIRFAYRRSSPVNCEFSARVRDGTAMVTDSSSPSGSPGAA
jgi:hypothetical protein